jgi:hypothetical protein
MRAIGFTYLQFTMAKFYKTTETADAAHVAQDIAFCGLGWKFQVLAKDNFRVADRTICSHSAGVLLEVDVLRGHLHISAPGQISNELRFFLSHFPHA